MLVGEETIKVKSRQRNPNGTNTITVKYDYLSRPSVYKGNKKIFSYNGPGYMESVYYDVEWVSEDELILKATNNKYKNDVYTIASYTFEHNIHHYKHSTSKIRHYILRNKGRPKLRLKLRKGKFQHHNLLSLSMY